MKEPEWVSFDVVLAIHDEQLAEHGGADGVNDLGLLESALARPRNFYHYSADSNLSRLAAAYAAGICQNHPFIDGNKRTAWVVCAVFLELNGRAVLVSQEEVVEMMVSIAGNTISEEGFALWLDQQP